MLQMQHLMLLMLLKEAAADTKDAMKNAATDAVDTATEVKDAAMDKTKTATSDAADMMDKSVDSAEKKYLV